MKILLEQNKRHGHGFQLHVVHGPFDKTYDEQPWMLHEANGAARLLLDEFNQECGTNFKPTSIISFDVSALEANAKSDFLAARMLQDIRDKQFDLSIPAGSDYKTMMVNGKAEPMLNARGVIRLCYKSWRENKSAKGYECLRRFCQYIVTHGRKGGASAALSELEAIEDPEKADEWICRMFARYVTDKNGVAEIIQEVLG